MLNSIGGEITCSDLSCYIRDDCEPRHITGVCCPTYDNCPVLGELFHIALQKASFF